MTSPKDHTQQAAAQAVMGNFQLTAQLPQGKSFTVSGYLLDGESVESINARLDLLHGICDRQRTFAEIPELEVKLEMSIKRLDEIRKHYAALLDKKTGGKTISTQEKQALSVMDTNVKHHEEDIAKGREAIAEAKAKVGRT